MQNRLKMKYFTEILTEKINEDNQKIVRVKTKTERKNLQDARTELSKIKLQDNELKRIHKCYHDEHPPKKCEIV